MGRQPVGEGKEDEEYEEKEEFITGGKMCFGRKDTGQWSEKGRKQTSKEKKN